MYNRAMRARQFVLPFLKRVQVAKDTYSFYFDRSASGGDWDFLPGQYIRLTLPHAADNRGTSRFFTISSSPLQKDVLILTVRILDSSFKRTLFSLPVGYKAQFFGPMGRFILQEDLEREQVFLAGGIGITTFYSMIMYAAAKNLPLPIMLLVSFSNREDAVFYEELTALAQQNKYINVIYTFSNAHGRISEELLKKHIPDLYQPIYSIVGSPAMVEETRKLLTFLQVAEENIITEDFTGY